MAPESRRLTDAANSTLALELRVARTRQPKTSSATPSNAEAQRQVLQCPVAVEESKAASAGVPGETEVRSAEVVSSGDNRQMTRCASGPLFRPASARWKVLVQMQLLLKFTLYSPENHLTTRFHSWSFMESAPTGKLERYGCSLLHTFMF
ncbi:hypothetical protein GN956_G5126 [Arapaima gigas]